MTTQKGRRGRIGWEHVAGIMLAALWLFLAIHGALQKSLAIDEIPHIGSGVAVAKHQDFRMNPEHPPLFKALSAVPVLLLDNPPVDTGDSRKTIIPWNNGDQWRWGYYLVFLESENPQRTIFLSRIVPMLVGLLGGLLAWLWGSEIGGRRAGLFAMALLLFYPEYLGHSRFVTLDVPTLVSGAALSWFAWRWWKRPGWGRGVVLVLASALLVLVKLPVGIYLVFLWTILLILLLLLPVSKFEKFRRWLSFAPGTVRPRWWQYLVLTACLLLLGFAFQWGASAFRFSLEGEPPLLEQPNSYATPKPDSGLIGSAAHFLHEYRVLPEASIAVLNHAASFEGRIVHLLGEQKVGGWSHYFLITTLIKTPFVLLAGLLLVGGRVVRLFRQKRGYALERLVILAGPGVLLFIVMAFSEVSIGHRHILFIYFPWAVLLGAELARWTRKRFVFAMAGWVAVAIVVAECVWIHPHHATYFNNIAGGSSAGGFGWVRDSNIDWGQDLPLAAETLDEYGFEKVNLAYFGMNRPEAFGIEDYNFILPDYPYAILMPDATAPDPALPSVVSLQALQAVRYYYGGVFHREPLAVCNSILIFPPEKEE